MRSGQFLTMTVVLIIKFRVDPSRRNWLLTCLSEIIENHNSPGLWPLACQIPDIIQSINHSINSWFLVLGLWCLGLGSYCFFDSPGAHMGVRQGGFQGDVPRADPTYTTLQLRLKIALVFDPVSLRFWVHLGSQDDPQNPPKSLKKSSSK